MKKLLLAGALAFSTFTVTNYMMDQITEAQAKTTVKKITEKDIAAYKKGTFVGANGSLGMPIQTLKKKSSIKYISGSYVQKKGKNVFNYDPYTYKNYSTINSKYIEMMHAEYNYKVNETALKKHKNRSLSHEGSNVYKIGKNIIEIQTSNYGTYIDMFRNNSDYMEYQYTKYN